MPSSPLSWPGDPPRRCPHPYPFELSLALGLQVGEGLTLAQILAEGKRSSLVHHGQFLYASKHLSHGTVITVCDLDPKKPPLSPPGQPQDSSEIQNNYCAIFGCGSRVITTGSAAILALAI
jgi:hypothetical protein